MESKLPCMHDPIYNCIMHSDDLRANQILVSFLLLQKRGTDFVKFVIRNKAFQACLNYCEIPMLKFL